MVSEGDLRNLVTFVILLGVAAIAGGITVRLLGSMQTTVLANTSTAVTNESLNVTANNTYMNLINSLNNSSQQGETGGFEAVARSPAVDVRNTSRVLTENTDYQIEYRLGQFKVIKADNNSVNGSRFNITYTYHLNSTGDDWLTFKEGKKGIKELASWWDDIAMIMAAIVIIGSLFGLYAVYSRYRRPVG